ncbi:MAG: polysaccharide deacetylase family protein, partial [Syntrophothermus sp.]
TEYRENLHEYFEIGKEIETFSSESELIDKINYYSTNATAREKIALQGKIRCHSYHSMYQKTRELDNLVKERLSSFKNTKTNHNAMNTINQKEFSVQPVSRLFGFDRGNPIDRYYIEKFLQNNRRDIKGTVVEIAENTYTKRFGNNVTESLILSYTKAPNVDIVGDFATGENIPKSRFDCIILTQTIQFIYDVKSALLNAYNSLRDGGTLLLTASGISQISRYDMDRWGEFWRFTDRTFEALIKDVIPSAEFEIDTFGNVAVAKAFLDGLAYEEIPQDVLDYKDPDYQVLLSVKIKKNSNVTHGYKELLKKEHPHKENAPVHKQPAKQADSYEANVLLYHRIANDPLDTQLLTVTPENFDEHLKVLKNNFNIVPLSSLIRSVKEKSIEPRTIAITFDDGYLDNYTYALPLLEKQRVPATIFVTAGMVGSQEEFWWDALERILFVNNNLPQRLNLSSDKETYDLSLVSPTDKFKAYEIIHSILKNQSVSERSELINALLNWGGLSKEGRQSHRIMNQEELKKISVSPYIEIGSHTVSHQKLSSLGYNEQYQELSNSRTLLESIINKPVTTLSYPFGSLGDINNDTIRATINAGYIAGIANYPAPVNDSANLFAVPRWLVRNWNADNFVRWIGSADKNYFETEMLKERNNNIINFLSR